MTPVAFKTAALQLSNVSATVAPTTSRRGGAPVEGVQMPRGYDRTVFSDEALAFMRDLVRDFRPERDACMRQRRVEKAEVEARIAAGVPAYTFVTPQLKPGDTANWKGPEIPKDLKDRRVEMTGPVNNASMVYNSMHCGASGYMADFEDSVVPTFNSIQDGQRNLQKLCRHELRKGDAIADPNATTYHVRPRGLHLNQADVTVDGQTVPGAFLDFAIDFFNNARQKMANGSGPYYYIPKLESEQEAALWAKVFSRAEQTLGIPHGSVRATVLIETFPAVFKMEAIAYALKEYIAGENCGRWDYLFSWQKMMHSHPEMQLPDRQKVTMQESFMSRYAEALIDVCHAHGIHAMGGMSTQVPYKIETGMPAEEQERLRGLNRQIMDKIEGDKTWEAEKGFDGAWSAHPGLVPELITIFKRVLQGRLNQLDAHPKYRVTEAQLLTIPKDLQAQSPTELGLRTNVNVVLQYVNAYLHGSGFIGTSYIPIGQKTGGIRVMEDMATAEVSRFQVAAWLEKNTPILYEDGVKRPIQEVFSRIVDEEVQEFKTNKYVVKYDQPGVASPEIFDNITLPVFKRLMDLAKPSFPDFIPTAIEEVELARAAAKPLLSKL